MTVMNISKELQEINKWLDQIIWEVNKFNETIEDLAARNNFRITDTKEE